MTWSSCCALCSLFMKGKNREQHMACISPSLAAALGTSHAQFLLLHSTAVVLQHIFSSLRYCSCTITVKIEPRNVIIDLYVRYHYEQENKWFSASNSMGLTKIVAWVFTSILSEIIRSFSRPKKEIIILDGKKINFSLYLKFEEKKEKNGIMQKEKAFFLQIGFISMSFTHIIILQELDFGMERLFVRNWERMLVCVNNNYPQGLLFQGRKRLLETCVYLWVRSSKGCTWMPF